MRKDSKGEAASEYADVADSSEYDYVVTAPHQICETNPGETVRLHADDPLTMRLLSRGQIARQTEDNTEPNGTSDDTSGAKKKE